MEKIILLLLLTALQERKDKYKFLESKKTNIDKNDDLIQVIVNSEVNKDQEKKLKEFGRIKYKLPLIDSYVLEIPNRYIKDLKLLKGIKKVEKDTRITANMNVASKTVKADKINSTGYRGKGISVAVLDTGIFPHDDFIYPRNRIIKQIDYINKKEGDYDDNGHGTHVAGIIGGNGYCSKGKYKGIAPECNLLSLKVLDNEGLGAISDVIVALQWIVDNKNKYNIRIANISMGTKPIEGEDSALIKAVNAVWDSGIVVITSAGNQGPQAMSITTPGISRKVITVGSSDDKETVEIDGDIISDYSGRGPTKAHIKKPDVVAPGAKIMSCCNSKGEYIEKSGTSMAAPIVAGCVALLLQKKPNLTPNDVKLKLKDSTLDLGFDQNYQGWGLIDMEKFIS